MEVEVEEVGVEVEAGSDGEVAYADGGGEGSRDASGEHKIREGREWECGWDKGHKLERRGGGNQEGRGEGNRESWEVVDWNAVRNGSSGNRGEDGEDRRSLFPREHRSRRD